MTRGRRGEKTYTGPNGATTDRLRALDKLRSTTAGQASRVAAPSLESVRQFIAEQRCPYCGQGPYRILSLHTGRTHGVAAAELRAEAGLTKSAVICDPEVSRNAAERRRGVRLPDVAYERTGGRRQYSEAGLAVQREKLTAARSPEQAKAAGVAAATKTLAKNAEKHERILHLWTTTRSTYAGIGEQVGMHPRSVRESLRRAGVVLADGRAIRWGR